jgi:hypoxanthine phosphoribosyltransferase
MTAIYTQLGIGTGANRKDPITVEESDAIDKHHFLIPPHYIADISSVLIPKGMIVDRIEKLAMDIHEHYNGETVHLVCILKGSRGFFSQLCNFLNKIHKYNKGHKNPPYIEHYVRLKSYQNTNSTDKVQMISDELGELTDKNLLLVEDIIDSGKTLSFFLKELIADIKPKSIKIASMLEKRTLKSIGIKADFVGFSIPDVFIVGYCMDYNEYFRDLDHLAIMGESGIEKYKDEGEGMVERH